MSILIGLAAYCLFSYITYWFIFLRGSSGGCGLDVLAGVLGIFAPILLPYYLFKEVGWKVRRLFAKVTK